MCVTFFHMKMMLELASINARHVRSAVSSRNIDLGDWVSMASTRARTADVLSDAGSFHDLLLPQHTVSALASAGFVRPSPVQQAAIPLGRVGSDLLVQAKSGTGKTVVFAVICLERVKLEVGSPQALILAPTREVAFQSAEVIQKIAAALPQPAPSCAVFVGGLPSINDEKRLRRTCHIVVGTPGRICSLLHSGALPAKPLSMLVLDEADQLMGDSFYADVAWAYDQLPQRKQVMAFSATYTPTLLADLEPLLKRPQRVMMCEETVSLIGIQQYYRLVGSDEQPHRQPQQRTLEGPTAGGREEEVTLAASGAHEQGRQGRQGQQEGAGTSGDTHEDVLPAKLDALLELLSTMSFHQAAVFCNRKPAAEWLARRLTAAGYPAAQHSGDLPQTDRMAAMDAVRGFRLRVIVSTDVMARGVDLDRVNLVANLDLPPDAATYVHRVGRTGRFGSKGVAVALVTRQELEKLLGYVASVGGGELLPLPRNVPSDMYAFDLSSDWEKEALGKLLQAPTTTPPASPPPTKHSEAPQHGNEGKGQEQEGRPESRHAAQDDGGRPPAGPSAAAGSGDQQAPLDAYTYQQQQQQQQQQAYWDAYNYSSYYCLRTGYGSQPGYCDSTQPGSSYWQWQWPGTAAGQPYAVPNGAHPCQRHAAVSTGPAEDEVQEARDASEADSLPEDEELDMHASALMSRLHVSIHHDGHGDTAMAGRGAEPRPSRQPNAGAASTSHSHQVPGRKGDHPQSFSSEPHCAGPPDSSQPACPHCWPGQYARWLQAYNAWLHHYAQWQQWQHWYAYGAQYSGATNAAPEASQ